jgi:hypothetical protein
MHLPPANAPRARRMTSETRVWLTIALIIETGVRRSVALATLYDCRGGRVSA